MGIVRDAQRTVQFLYERSPVAVIRPHIPTTIWVFWPPLSRRNYTLKCDCQHVFHVVPESAAETMKKMGYVLSFPEERYVCGCYGRVIE